MELQRHTCPSCGAHIEIDPHAQHATCEYCGQGFAVKPPESSATRACLGCGYNNASDARYCNDCGASLGGSDRLPQMTITVEAPPPQAGQRKVCPFCREDIAAAAIKCKHCNEYLDGRPRAGAAPRISTADIARTWAGRYFDDCPHTLAQLKPWSALSPQKVQGIAKAYKLQAGENGLALLNETFFGSGKKGVVLTDQRVVWRLGRNKGDVSLSYLTRVENQYGWFKPKKLWFNKHELDPTYATQGDLTALCELLQRIVSDRINRGISPGQQTAPGRRGNWGMAMLHRVAAPAQSGGAKGGSFGLGCLLMFGCCCFLPQMANRSTNKYVQKAKQNQARHAKQAARRHLQAAQDAAQKGDPVRAWTEAEAAIKSYKAARDAHSIRAKRAKALMPEQAALATPILLERGRRAVEQGDPKAGQRQLKQALRAHQAATKAGKQVGVKEAEIRAAIQAATASDPAAQRGPKPRVGARGDLPQVGGELRKRYPNLYPRRWSALVAVGPHWVVDVELSFRARGRGFRRRKRHPNDGKRTHLRVWLQQAGVTDVREIRSDQFGVLKDATPR